MAGLVSILPSGAVADCDVAQLECRLAKKFAPKFWFYDAVILAEVQFPSDVEFVLDAARLRLRHRRGIDCTKEVLPKANSPSIADQNRNILDGVGCNNVTSRRTPSDRHSHTTKRDYFVDILADQQSEIHKGKDPRVYGDTGVALYANVVGRTSAIKPHPVISYEIQYFVFFPKDDNHAGDWETVIVHVERDETPISVATYGHGHVTHVSTRKEPHQSWFANDAGEELEGMGSWSAQYSHPVVFVSLGKHAMYLTPGVKRRGILADDIRNRGVPWRAHSNVVTLVPPKDASGDLSWIRYAGKWGARFGRFFLRNHVNSPRGPIVKKPFCFGAERIDEYLGEYPSYCSPLCDQSSNWAKVYKNLDKPAISDTHRWAIPYETKFENTDYARMDFTDQTESVEVCLNAIPKYYLFEHHNFGGRSFPIESGGVVELREEASEIWGEVSSSTFDTCSTLNSSWVAFFKNNRFRGKSYLMDVAVPSNVDDFRDIPGMVKEVSSIRWCLPKNVNFIAFEDVNQVGRSITIKGTGRVEEIDLTRHGINHALNDRLSSGEFVQTSIPNQPGLGLSKWNLKRPVWFAGLGLARRDRFDRETGLAVEIRRNIWMTPRLRVQPHLLFGNGLSVDWSASIPIQWNVRNSDIDWYLGGGPIVARTGDVDSNTKYSLALSSGIEFEIGRTGTPYFVGLQIPIDNEIYDYSLVIGMGKR